MSMILNASGLKKSYLSEKGSLFKRERRFFAVDDVSLSLRKGETLGIVGESGCGKSTLSRLLLGLASLDAGTVEIEGQPSARVSSKAWRTMRQRMQMVFQNAHDALDPRMRVRAQVEEALQIHKLPVEAAEEALVAVGLSGTLAERFPHELSGGQLQRVVIARALALKPKLLVLDEPVSALDVSIQAQIINLLVDLQKERDLTYVFVSHDLGVVRHISDRVAVMYLGKIVEISPTSAFYNGPLHPYSRALLDAVPKPDPDKRTPFKHRLGDPPDPAHPPGGCRFHPRCPLAIERCSQEVPALRDFNGRKAACHLAEENL